jgi:hypothetical protein
MEESVVRIFSDINEEIDNIDDSSAESDFHAKLRLDNLMAFLKSQFKEEPGFSEFYQKIEQQTSDPTDIGVKTGSLMEIFIKINPSMKDQKRMLETLMKKQEELLKIKKVITFFTRSIEYQETQLAKDIAEINEYLRKDQSD